MLSTALDQLEHDLSIRLPADVRRALADPAVHEAFRRVMLDAAPGLYADDAAADTARSLRENNRSFRASATWVAWEDPTPPDAPESASRTVQPWPHHWLWVGHDGSGDAYFLDLSRDPAPLALWSHDARTCRVDRPSFAAWIDAYRAYGQECLRSNPPPPPRNPPYPKCRAELTAARARICRACGARW